MTHRLINPRRLMAAAGLALALASIAGCRYNDVDSFLIQRDRLASAEPYTIAPPDTLQIVAAKVPEIHNANVTVSPDGTVNLPLIGEVQVSGKTAPEVAAMLEDRCLEYYQEADVVVQVVGFRSKHLYVFGEVGSPGRYAYTGSDTVLDVLSRAQPTRLADGGRIQIIRPGPDGHTAKRMTVSLNKFVHDGVLDRNAQLEEGDIIYVPPHGLAHIGLTLQQLLLPLQPAAATVRAPLNVSDAAGDYQGSSANQ